MQIVRVVFVIISLLCLAFDSHAQAVDQVHHSLASDGEYVGLERDPTLSRATGNEWFHENTLMVRNNEAILDKVPLMIRNGTKEYSASDGGFFTYRARFMRRGGQSFVAMRQFRSEYIIFTGDKRKQFTQIETYPVKFISGRIEFDGVTYKPTKLEKSRLGDLLHLLRTEPLVKASAAQ